MEKNEVPWLTLELNNVRDELEDLEDEHSDLQARCENLLIKNTTLKRDVHKLAAVQNFKLSNKLVHYSNVVDELLKAWPGRGDVPQNILQLMKEVDLSG